MYFYSYLNIQQNYRSCFEEPANNSSPNVDLNQPYEILNSSISSSQIRWNDVGIFVFTLKVVDPEFRWEEPSFSKAIPSWQGFVVANGPYLYWPLH